MLLRTTLSLVLLASALQAHAAEADAVKLCRSDAFRLCLSEIPDRDRIGACLESRRSELSPGCRSLFDTSGQQPVAATARR